MVSSTRTSQRAKGGENANGRVTRSSEKGINPHSNVSETAAIRKSSREVSSKKIVGSPSSTRKSERLEKKTPTPPPTASARRKSGRLEKKKTSSPSTTPARTRSHSSSTPSKSKTPRSLASRQKLKKEKSVKRLTFEAMEVNVNQERDLGTSEVKTKKMDARMYRALFKKGKKGCLPKSNRIGGSSQEGDNNSSGGRSGSENVGLSNTNIGENPIGAKNDNFSKGSFSDHKEVFMNGTLPSEDAKAKETTDDSRSNGTVTGLVENNVTPGSLIPSSAPTYETSMATERIQPDCCGIQPDSSGEETLPVPRNSMLGNDLVKTSVGHEGVEKLLPSKRKGITVDMDSDVSATLSKDDTYNFITDASPPRLGGNTLDTDGPCSKKKRLDYNRTVNESCDPCAIEDGDGIVATMLQKSYPANATPLDGQSDSDKDGLISNSNKNVVQMKEKLSSHIAYRCKSDSFKFVEYWVPVQMSHMQLEQYCATLLSNASTLRSSLKIDSVGAIRDVLISIWKCCNHPYVVDPSLQNLLLNGLGAAESLLDVGIKASGKLQLLDTMLRELKKNDLRALVLFQSIGGSGKDTIGDILEDVLGQRFGPDSYERVDKGLTFPIKQAAMKRFNDKNNGCFVFLLEACACLPSIKLSSIDTIIIFDSDWNPMNDIRSLQKVTLDSQFESIKMFRFYSAFTVEEKALMLATKDKTLDINFMSTNRGTSHMVLMWGASCLFDELRVFHDGATSSLKSLFGGSLLEETVQEFSSVLSEAGKDTDTSNCSILLKVQQNGGAYRTNVPLFGERKLRPLDEESPQLFWTKLLEGKQFQWKYSCSSSQRSRKRVQRYGSLVGGPDLVSDGIAKKQRKVSNNTVDQPSLKFEGEKLSTGTKTDRPQGNDVESEKKSRVNDEQRSLYLSLKPEITKLCEVLLLPDNVTKMAENFLEYVMNNHQINREPVSILQAFQISLIWIAAALLKHKLDHKASLILAKQYLNFDCKKGEVDYIYSMLRCLRKIFLYRTGSNNGTDSPKASKSSNSVYSCTEVAREVELFKTDLSKSIKEIRKKCGKQMKKLHLMQQEEKQTMELQKDEFERRYKIELALIRSCSPNDATRTEKLKLLNVEYEKLKCEFEASLEDIQSARILRFREWEATWVEDVKFWAHNEFLKTIASKELGTGVDNMVESMTETGTGVPENGSEMPSLENWLPINENLAQIHVAGDCNGSNNSVTVNSPLSDERIGSRNIVSVLDREAPLEMPGTVNITSCPVNVTALNPTLSTEHVSDGGAVNELSDSVLSRPFRPASLSNDPDNITILDQHLEHRNSNGVSSSVPEEQIRVEVQETNNEEDSVSVLERQVRVKRPGDCPDTIFLSNPPLEQQILDVSLSIPGGDIPITVPENSHAMADFHQAIESSRDAVLADQSTTCDQDEGVLRTVTEDTLSLESLVLERQVPVERPGDCPDTIFMSNPPLEQQIPDVSLSIPDGDIPVTVPENSHAMADCHQDIDPSRDTVLADQSTTCDQEEGVLRTATEDTLSLENLVSRSVNVMEPLEQGQQLPSVESPPDKNSAGEMQNSSEQVELASNSADAVLANQPDVASSDFRFATEAEHQPINVSDLPAHNPEASTMAPNPDVVQPHSNFELESSLHQVAMNPATNSDLDSLTASGVRTQSSNPRNLSTPLEMNDHHIQTAARSASRMFAHLYHDPLKNEYERIQKVIEQTKKHHEEMKLQMESDFEKELEELRRKYDLKLQEMEVEFQQRKKTLDASFNTVSMNRNLADAFRSKCLDIKVSGASGMQQDSSFAQQLLQLSRRQRATRPLLVSSFSSCESPAISLPSPSTAASAQHMTPPIQAGYNISGPFSGVSPRSPLINSRPSPMGDIQAGGSQVRAPAPHLQPYTPATFLPVSSFPAVPPGMSSQPSPRSIPAISPLFSQGPPRPRLTTYQSDLQRGRQADSAGGLATPKLPAMNLRGNASNQSTTNLTSLLQYMTDVASVKVSRSGTNSNTMQVNSSQATTPDLVCLSDDD